MLTSTFHLRSEEPNKVTAPLTLLKVLPGAAFLPDGTEESIFNLISTASAGLT